MAICYSIPNSLTLQPKSLQPQSQQLESDQAADPQFEIAPNDEDEAMSRCESVCKDAWFSLIMLYNVSWLC